MGTTYGSPFRIQPSRTTRADLNNSRASVSFNVFIICVSLLSEQVLMLMPLRQLTSLPVSALNLAAASPPDVRRASAPPSRKECLGLCPWLGFALRPEAVRGA